MASISIASLSQKMTKKFKTMGVKKVHEHALKYLIEVQKRISSWEKETRRILSTPASKRGRIGKGKSLNPHNKMSYNKGFPMMVSGKLMDSLYTKVSLNLTSDGARIRVTRAIGKDLRYAYILNSGGKNNANMVLKDYMTRLYEKLDDRIYNLTQHQGGFE